MNFKKFVERINVLFEENEHAANWEVLTEDNNAIDDSILAFYAHGKVVTILHKES